jgi:hypothetical protein
MASEKRVLFEGSQCLASLLLAAAAWTVGSTALAADTLPYEPPCPLLASPGSSSSTLLQPMRIKPQQVKAKNAMGCLSPSDAIYGPDGCPLRFCGQNSGTFQFR